MGIRFDQHIFIVLKFELYHNNIRITCCAPNVGNQCRIPEANETYALRVLLKQQQHYTTFEHVSEANILQRFIKFTVVSEPITNTSE